MTNPDIACYPFHQLVDALIKQEKIRLLKLCLCALLHIAQTWLDLNSESKTKIKDKID